MGHFRVHPLTFGNDVRLYRRGRRAFEDMLEAIEAARDHVNLETYLFEADATGRRTGFTSGRPPGATTRAM